MRQTPAELENERERRRTYLDKLIVWHPGSETEGAGPRTLPRTLLSEVHTRAPILDVIREKCLENV